MDPLSEELLAFLAEVGLQGYASNILHTHQFTSLKQMQELITTDEDVLSLGIEPLAHRKALLAGLKRKGRRGSTKSTVVATITPPAPLTSSRRDILVGGAISSAPAASTVPPPQPHVMDLSQRSSNMSMCSQLLTPHLEEASLVTARSVVQTLTQLTSGMEPRGVGGAAAASSSSSSFSVADEARQRMQNLVSSLHDIVSAELIPALIRDVEGVVGRYEEILNEVVLSSRDQGMKAIIGGYEDLLDGDELRDLQEAGNNLPTSIMVDIGISMIGEGEESGGGDVEEEDDNDIPEHIVPISLVTPQKCHSTSPVPLRQQHPPAAEERSTAPCGYDGGGGGDSLPSCASSTSTLVVPSDNPVADFMISQATNDVDMLSPVGRPTLPPDHATRSMSPSTAQPIRQPPPPSPPHHHHHQPTTACPTLAEIDAMSATDITSMCDRLGLQCSYTDANEEDDWFEDMVAACAEGDDQPITPSQCVFLERSRSPDSRRPSNANRLRLKQLALRQEFASVALADLFGDLPNWRDRFPKSRSPTPPTTLTQSQAVDLLPRGEREKARKRLRVEDEQEANHQTIMALAAHSAAWVVDGLDPRLGADAGVQQHLSLFEKAVLREATSTPDMLAVAKEHLPSTTLGRVTSILTASGVPVISQKDSQAKASFFASKWRRKRFGGR